MTVWMVEYYDFIAVFDGKPTPHDLRELAREEGWPLEMIDKWTVEEQAVRESTAIHPMFPARVSAPKKEVPAESP